MTIPWERSQLPGRRAQTARRRCREERAAERSDAEQRSIARRKSPARNAGRWSSGFRGGGGRRMSYRRRSALGSKREVGDEPETGGAGALLEVDERVVRQPGELRVVGAAVERRVDRRGGRRTGRGAEALDHQCPATVATAVGRDPHPQPSAGGSERSRASVDARLCPHPVAAGSIRETVCRVLIGDPHRAAAQPPARLGRYRPGSSLCRAGGRVDPGDGRVKAVRDPQRAVLRTRALPGLADMTRAIKRPDTGSSPRRSRCCIPLPRPPARHRDRARLQIEGHGPSNRSRAGSISISCERRSRRPITGRHRRRSPRGSNRGARSSA